MLGNPGCAEFVPNCMAGEVQHMEMEHFLENSAVLDRNWSRIVGNWDCSHQVPGEGRLLQGLLANVQ